MLNRKIFYITICLLLSLSASATAEDVSFDVTVDRSRVGVGETLYLNLNFSGTQSVATPYFPGVDGFDWQYLGPSKKTSIINGVVSSSITHKYRLKALRVGSFEIPAFSIQYRGKTYTSEPIPVEIVSSSTRFSKSSQAQGATPAQDLEDRVFITVEVGKRQAYINEIIPITIKLYANNLTIKDIQYPELTHDGFSMDEFNQPTQYKESVKGVLHNVIEFKTNIFATRQGQLRLGPTQLSCNLLIREGTSQRMRPFFFDFGFDDDFFGSYKSYPLSLKAVDVPIVALSLPEEGKPDTFAGALGNYDFSVHTDISEVKVGDPITLKMKISGEGNLKTVTAPVLNFGDDFKTYEPEITQEGRTKILEQVIIPTNPNIDEIPEIDFSFFDAKRKEYKTITQGSIPIKVKPLPKGEQMRIFETTKEGTGLFRKKESLGRDIIYIKDTPGTFRRKGVFLCKNRLFIFLQLMPLILIIMSLIFQRRRERLQSDVGYARRLRASGYVRRHLRGLRKLLKTNDPAKFFDAVFKALQEYLGDKFHLPTAGITGNVVEELRHRGVDLEILDKLKECFTACDMARYTTSGLDKEKMQETLKLFEEIVDRLERQKV